MSLNQQNIKQGVQGLSLLLFLGLIGLGKIQLWMGIFIVALISSLFFSRWYCGWVCPMHTGMTLIELLKKKLGVPTLKIPRGLDQQWIRVFMLVIWLSMFGLVLFRGVKLPVLPGFFILSLLVALIFPSSLFHRLLCPYGFVLSIPARASKRTMNIEQKSCVQCGLCRKCCPSQAISKQEGLHRITAHECLVCHQCEPVCKKQSISFGKSL